MATCLHQIALGNASWASATSTATTTVFDTLGGVVLPGSAVDETADDFVFGSTQLDDDGNTDHDKRFFFDKSKGAFRVGWAIDTEWDENSLGFASFASGIGTTASGSYSMAMGQGTEANSHASTAFGFYTQASGSSSTAMGENTIASGRSSTAMGDASTASGSYSLAQGFNATASGYNAISMGSSPTASGENSLAVGYYSTASGESAIAIGNTTVASSPYSTAIGYGTEASGTNSMALGTYTEAPSSYETTVGSYNTSYTPSSGWDEDDRLFTVGNGTADISRSDAMVILKSGNTGLGTSTPDATLHIDGSIKYEDGNQADGYVLTSDSLGNASWQAASAAATDTMDILSDADGDTKILVEESTDEDHLRFYASGKEVITVTNDGDVSIGRSTETITTSIIESHETGDYSTSSSGCASCFGDDNWQSFTLEENETVESIELYFENNQSDNDSVTLDFVLYEGQGTGGTVIYQASGITFSGFSGNPWVAIDVPDFVASSGKYTIYLSESLFWYYSSGSNGYSDGRNSNNASDYLFRIYGLAYNDNYVKVTSSGLEVGDYVLPYEDGTRWGRY